MTVYKTRKIGTGYGLLIRKCDWLVAIRYVNAEQRKTGVFYNIKRKPYKGKIYDPQRFEWLVVG